VLGSISDAQGILMDEAIPSLGGDDDEFAEFLRGTPSTPPPR
jgi:hypothetical protein